MLRGNTTIVHVRTSVNPETVNGHWEQGHFVLVTKHDVPVPLPKRPVLAHLTYYGEDGASLISVLVEHWRAGHFVCVTLLKDE